MKFGYNKKSQIQDSVSSSTEIAQKTDANWKEEFIVNFFALQFKSYLMYNLILKCC